MNNNSNSIEKYNDSKNYDSVVNAYSNSVDKNNLEFQNYMRELEKQRNDKSRYKCKACTFIRILLLASSGFMCHCLLLRMQNDKSNQLFSFKNNQQKYIKMGLLSVGFILYYCTYKKLILEKYI